MHQKIIRFAVSFAFVAVVATSFLSIPDPAAAVPGNDDFSSATALGILDLPFSDTVDTTGATTEASEPTPSCIGGASLGASVWYSFTVSGVINRDIAVSNLRTTSGSEYDATIAVYTGASLATLSEVSCAFVSGSFNPELTGWTGTPGTTYYIQVVGRNSATGTLEFQLGRAGSLSGRIVDTLGTGTCSTQIQIYSADKRYVGSANATCAPGSEGEWSRPYLHASNHPAFGDYRLWIRPISGAMTDYPWEWYDDKVAFGLADPVTITADTDNDLGDQEIDDNAGTINGTITDVATGDPLSGYKFANIYDSTGTHLVRDALVTDGTGFWEAPQMAPGSYLIEFEDPVFTDYLVEWYDDAANAAGATAVVVTDGGTTTADAALTPVQGWIEGNVTDSGTTNPIEDVLVRAWNSDGTALVAYGNTDASGDYLILLDPGDYRLSFNYVGYWFEVYDEVATTTDAGATVLAVTAATGITVDESLDPLPDANHITGTVTDSLTGLPIEGIRVQAIPTVGGNSLTFTAADGTYDIAIYQTGTETYDVSFTDDDDGYRGELWDDIPQGGVADSIELDIGEDVAGIDAALDPGAITGTVTGGGPLAGIEVTAYDAGMTEIASALTDGSGDYVITRLDNSTLYVEFRDPNGLYATEWYDDKATHGTATAVVVARGSTNTGNDAVLATGTISGTVTDHTGTPLSGVKVKAIDGGGSLAGIDTTAGDGTYEITPLGAANYDVKFIPSTGTHSIEWYDDQTDAGSADPVAVSFGVNTANVDAMLDLAPGSISGTVTDPVGAKISGAVVKAFDGSGKVAGTDTTAADGEYEIEDLAAGDYTVKFVPPSGDHAIGWHDGQSDQGSADAVTVNGASATTGIDAELLPTCNGKTATIVGTNGPDVLLGSGADDVIVGYGGGDEIKGRGGNDTICAGSGNDDVYGMAGDDYLDGGPGTDAAIFNGSAGAVVASLVTGTATGEGSDTLVGFENLTGSPFADTLTGDSGPNRIAGFHGDDVIDGKGGDDVLLGEDDDDELTGGNGDDELVGGRDDDLLRGQDGDDEIKGRGGFDTADFSGSSAGVIVSILGGTATGEGSDTVIAVEHLTGSDFDDELYGSGRANTLIGGRGNDFLKGNDGFDTLDGGAGDDDIRGGAGGDTIAAGSGDDTISGMIGNDIIDGGTGTDSASYSGAASAVEADLSAGTASGDGNDTLTRIENLIGSAFGDTLTGNTGANQIDGRSGDDTLDGGAGDDDLIGGSGDDDLDGGTGNDTIAGGTGTDVADGGGGSDTCTGETENNCEF